MTSKKNPLLRFADVAPAIPLPGSKSQVFTYRLQAGQKAKTFSLVHVPFGRRFIPGVVMSLHGNKPAYKTKQVKKVLPHSLTPYQVALAKWIARTMHGSLGFTLRLFTPPAPLARSSRLIKTKHGYPEKKTLSAQSEAFIDFEFIRRWKSVAKRIKRNLADGSQVLVLVPEVWMAREIADLLRQQIRAVPVAEYSSGQRPAELRSVWQIVGEGRGVIVIGTQKAMFLPWCRLTTIVLEEEYYASHKLWDQYPRLNNVTGAKTLAEIHQADFIFSSSFPSLSLWYQSDSGKVELQTNKPAEIDLKQIVSSIHDRRAGNLLPAEFVANLRRWRKGHDKILIFYNRRGAWQALQCRSCHHRVKCTECGSALAVHGTQQRRRLICHVCAYHRGLPDSCPECGKKSLRFIGMGAETMEAIVRQLLDGAGKVVRIDADTAASHTPAQMQKLIRNAKIVIATSALFTQHGGQKFGRIAWLFPERNLQFPDFRSAERSLQTCVRLQSLRAGRRQLVLVTRVPHLIEAISGDVTKTYQKILRERKRLHYPPFSSLVKLTIRASSADRASLRAAKLRQQIDNRSANMPNVKIRGPYQGFAPKSGGHYESHLLLAGELSQLVSLYADLVFDVADIDPERIL